MNDLMTVIKNAVASVGDNPKAAALRDALKDFQSALAARDRLEKEQARLESFLREAETSTRFDDGEFVAQVAAAPVQLRMIDRQLAADVPLLAARAALRDELAALESDLLARQAALRARIISRLADKAKKAFAVPSDTQLLWRDGEIIGPCTACAGRDILRSRPDSVAELVFPHTPAGLLFGDLPQAACFQFSQDPVAAASGLLAWDSSLARVEKLAAAL